MDYRVVILYRCMHLFTYTGHVGRQSHLPSGTPRNLDICQNTRTPLSPLIRSAPRPPCPACNVVRRDGLPGSDNVATQRKTSVWSHTLLIPIPAPTRPADGRTVFRVIPPKRVPSLDIHSTWIESCCVLKILQKMSRPSRQFDRWLAR